MRKQAERAVIARQGCVYCPECRSDSCDMVGLGAMIWTKVYEIEYINRLSKFIYDQCSCTFRY